MSDITGGAQTVHPWQSEFESVDCRVCGYHYLAPVFADHAALLAEPALSHALSGAAGKVEGEVAL